MALDIIILSVLRTGPIHGYELKRRVQRPTLRQLSNNSLYPALRRFEALGAVTKVIEKHDGKPDRKVYAITDDGRRLLTSLISNLPPELASSDEEFLVRLSFFNEIDVEHRLSILAARAAVLDATAAQVRILLHESQQSTARQWRNLAMTQLVSTIEHERRWIAELAITAESKDE